MNFLINYDPDLRLYGIEDEYGALLYEAQFNYAEAGRLLRCVNRDSDLTWEECADYVEGRTDVMPVNRQWSQP